MKFSQKLDNFFEISARNSTIKTEIMGGLTTFFAMCYIMLVNPATMVGGQLGDALYDSVYIATAIGAIVGTLLMAFAKMPFAQASGMGLNAFFFSSFMLGGIGSAASGSSEAYAAGLSVIFVSGLVFMFLSATGLRKKISEAMPMCLKKAIPAGIGLFIAFIGFKNAGLVQFNPWTFVQIGNFNINGFQFVIDLSTGTPMVAGHVITWFDVAPAFSALLGVLIITALSKTKLKKANVILGILITTGIFYLCNIGNDALFANIQALGENMNPAKTFEHFGEYGVQGWFNGFKYWEGATALNIILLVITFCLVDMFDTLGTLQGTATEAGMLDENGNPINLNKCLMADSTATVVGAMMGTSTVTTFVESASGVSAGARTGLASVVTALLFFIAMFLTPIAAVVPGAATAPALIYVGVLMLKNFKDVDFSDLTSAVPAFFALIMMPLTYSISNGIAMGMITYIILKFFNVFFTKDYNVKEYFAIGKGQTGEFFSKDIIVLIIAVLFAVRFFMVHN